MEYFDICDEAGIPTGDIVERSIAHRDGIRHRTAHVWVVRPQTREVLLQRRSANKDSFPNRLDTSSAGHIPAGQEPLESALRELYEELGIRAEASDLIPIGAFDIRYSKEFYGKIFRDNEWSHVFAYIKPVNIEELKLQAEEVSEVVWEKVDDVVECVKRHDQRYCVPSEGLSLAKDFLDTVNKI